MRLYLSLIFRYPGVLLQARETIHLGRKINWHDIDTERKKRRSRSYGMPACSTFPFPFCASCLPWTSTVFFPVTTTLFLPLPLLTSHTLLHNCPHTHTKHTMHTTSKSYQKHNDNTARKAWVMAVTYVSRPQTNGPCHASHGRAEKKKEFVPCSFQATNKNASQTTQSREHIALRMLSLLSSFLLPFHTVVLVLVP